MAFEIEKATERIIRQLYNNGDTDKASLSALRSAATIDGYRAQKVWPVFLSNLDEQWLSKNGKATREEAAIFVAVRMYARHQQASDSCVFGRRNYSDKKDEETNSRELFEALNWLKQGIDSHEALDRRVQALLGTNNYNAVIDQLVHLMQIIKSKKTGIKIDYARLAGDLYKFQFGYRQANEVRLRWGEQYYRAFKKLDTNQQ
ncbi:type I-E CRISPR-associated protein Cse2/CasB [Lactobacillus delbrueckii]|uniref:type I-E CRISPR-associated protein Cse2/CasB n=1 Tax=Lactobacillus delbrueckii TaxID=1584 RepID=UPI00059F655C|nr:type I-E CRISPR-associated protein Cse2/CasB [Lactobacillus delbrueckii]MBT8938312.1 type I-E CRISPR-associated protein Cse2/CasB [Lactobacillus delbrueckii subsp. bulgaricus]